MKRLELDTCNPDDLSPQNESIQRLAKCVAYRCQQMTGWPPVCGIVIGSCVTSDQDGYSDIDVIAICDKCPPRHIQAFSDEQLIDIRLCTTPMVSRALNRSVWRDNHYLLPLKTGRLLFDKDGNGARIIQRATDVWNNGPIEPLQCERLNIVGSMEKIRAAGAKLDNRFRFQTLSEDACTLTCLELANMYQLALTYYARVNRHWYFPSWVANKLRDDPFYCIVVDWHVRFTETANISSKVALLMEVTSQVINLANRDGSSVT